MLDILNKPKRLFVSMSQETLQGDLFSSQNPTEEVGGGEHEDGLGQKKDPYPFRLNVKEVSDEEIRRINEERGLKRARRFLPSFSAKQMAVQAASAVRSRLRSWLLHPSEDVIHHIVDRSHPEFLAKKDETFFKDLLYQRAVSDAEEEGVVWTPLLDSMASGWAWTGDPFYKHTWHPPTYQGRGWAFAEKDVENPRDFEYSHQRADRLIPWIKKQTDTKEVAKLVEFEFKHILELVAVHAQVVDLELVRALIEKHAHTSEIFVKNQVVSGELLDWIEEWGQNSLVGGRSGPEGAMNGYQAQNALVALEERVGNVKPEVRRAIIDKLSEKDSLSKNRWERGYPSWSDSKKSTCFATLMRLEKITPEEILDIYEAVRENSNYVEQVVKHPAADASLFKVVAQEISNIGVRNALVERGAALDTEEVVDVLRTSTSPQVLYPQLEGADKKEFRRLFRNIVKKDFAMAGKLLADEAFEDRRDWLRPYEVEFLYKHEDSNRAYWFKSLALLTRHGWDVKTEEGGDWVRESLEEGFEENFSLMVRESGVQGKTMIDIIEEGGDIFWRHLEERHFDEIIANTQAWARWDVVKKIAGMSGSKGKDMGRKYFERVARSEFKGLVTKNALKALEELENFGDMLKKHVYAEDLMPLVTSGNQKVRTQAVLAVRDLKVEGSAREEVAIQEPVKKKTSRGGR